MEGEFHKKSSDVGVLLGFTVFLSWTIAFPRILIVLSAGRKNWSCKILNLNVAAFLISFYLQMSK